jgi:hypothetical protein
MIIAASGEIRFLTYRKSPAKASEALNYREMITPIGLNCDENSCFGKSLKHGPVRL